MRNLLGSMLCAALLVFSLAAARPADALSNPLVIELHRANAAGTDASATIFRAETGLLVNVTANGKLPKGAALSLNTGSCSRPGGVAFALARLSHGASLTQLKHSLADIAERAKSMVIHQTSALNSAPFACGDITE